MHCIIKPIDGTGGLYLGNLESAKNANLLRSNRITALVTVMSTNELNCYDNSI